MRRLIGMMCAAIVSSAVAPTAQIDKKMDDQTVTVTGCVSAASGAGGYVLSNASMSGAMAMEKDKMAMADKDKMAMAEKDKMAMAEKDKMAMDKGTTAIEKSTMLSYVLVGGPDLKAHLGHKVEIAGSVPKAMDQMSKEPTTGMASKDMKPATLNVKSVKMISTTCP